MRNSQRKLFIMIIPAFVLLILFVYFPIVKGGVVAFQNYNLFDLTNVHFIGLDNFKAVITDRNFNFWRICLNTALWIFVSLFFQFVLGFGLALLMRKPFKGRGIYSALVFYPVLYGRGCSMASLA